jgi:TP901 family phage tail tape measure protein
MTKKVTLPIVAGFGASVIGANNVGKSLREVVTLTGETGAVADATFSEFQQGVADLSKELGIAQGELSGGLYSALSAGVPRDNAFEFMRVASQAAIAGVTDTETAVDGLTTVINAFGLDASQAQEVSDSLFTAVKGGKTTFGELSDSLFNIAPAAAAAGVNFQEVNAAIATLTASGVPTSVATTQLRAALTGLQRPSEELDSIFQNLGYQNAQMAIEAEGLGFALDAVKDASGGNNGELQKLLGSVEAVAAANTLAGTGAEKFASEIESQNTALGATSAAFDEIDKARGLDRLKVSIEGLAIQVGNVLLPVVEKVVDFLTPWVQKFQELDPNIQNIIVGALGLAAAIGPVLFVVGKVVSLFGTVITVIKGVGAAMSLLAANPVVLIIVAIAALVAGLIYAYQNFEGFRNVVDSVINAVGQVISFVWESIIKPVWDAIWWYIENVLIRYFQILWTVYSTIFKAIGEVIKFVWESVIKPIWDAVSWYIENVLIRYYKMLWEVVKAVWEGVSSAISTAWDFISGIFDAIKAGIETVANWIGDKVNSIVGFFTGLKDKITTAVSGLWDGFTRGAKTAFNWIADLWNNTIGKISFTVPDWVPKVGGKGFSFPQAPKFNMDPPALAKGGVIEEPTLALVGETNAATPEIVTPERLMRDIFNEVLNTRPSGTIINNFDVKTSTPQELAREIAWRQQRQLTGRQR